MMTMLLSSLAWATPCTQVAVTEHPARTACLTSSGGTIRGGALPEQLLPADATAVGAGPLGTFVVGAPGEVRVVDAVSGETLARQPVDGTPSRVWLVQDAALAWQDDDGRAWSWSPATGAVVSVPSGGSRTQLASVR